MKKSMKVFIIIIVSLVLLTVTTLATGGLQIHKMSSNYGINSYIIEDSGVEYIVVESDSGIAITPRLHK